MKIKYFLSDLDGVIRKFPSERDIAIEQKYKLSQGTLFNTAFEKTRLDKVVRGIISDKTWRGEIEKSISELYGEDKAKAAVKEWSEFPGILDSHYLSYVETAFQATPVALLTNGTSRLPDDLASLGLEKLFFKIFNSSEIGFCKPDPRIYMHVAEILRCMPSEIFFVDDSLSHIKSAQDLGFQTHHYKSLEGLKEAIESELLKTNN